MASTTFTSGAQLLLVLSVFLIAAGLRTGDASSFKFNIHHRFSDSVKGILHSEGLPEKHSPGYYASMVHRDRFVRGRRLATDTQLTFAYGNDTFFIPELGFLYYANVSVGTPSLDFFVALDTGSDLFWLPCECSSCFTYLNTTDGEKVMLNHYSPSDSTTSSAVPCSNSLCELSNQCTSNTNACPYEINYLSANTSSIGYLVEDALHLSSDDVLLKPVEAKITLGCGKLQTGIFARSAAPNGLIGLGMEKISVPSFLADQGLTSDSFSMCFGLDNYGRIDFGDTGIVGQKETPINPMLHYQSYNVTFNQIIVGGKVNIVPFTAIFDSGTSFTYLTEPAYSTISKQMDAGMELKRHTFDPSFPFEYCYELPSKTQVQRPLLNFTMKGGDDFVPLDIFIIVPIDDAGSRAACLAILKSTDIDLIGQNFMTGYRIVFNREKMVLGWSPSDCYDNGDGTPSGDTPPADSPPSDSPPADTPPADDTPPSNDSPPSADSPPSEDSPPSADSPPTEDSPPAPSTPGGRAGLPKIGTGDATRLNPLAAVFVAVLAILAIV